MASCKNCYLFDEFKLNSMAAFFEKRQDMVGFFETLSSIFKNTFWTTASAMEKHLFTVSNGRYF